MKQKIIKSAFYLLPKSMVLAMLVLSGFLSNAQTAQSVIAKHIETMGGKAKLNAINSYSFTEGSNTVYFKKPNKWRIDYTEDGKIVQSQLFYGEKGWTTFKSGETQLAYSGMGIENFLEGLLAHAALPDFKVEYLGQDDNSDNLLIKITPLINSSLGRYFKYYINPHTYKITKLLQESDVATITVSFSDYKSINGIMIPLTSSSVIDVNNRSYSTTKTNIKINIPLDDKLFAKPALKKEITAYRGPSGKYGYRDQDYVTIVNPRFDNTWNFTDMGIAKVELNKKFGFIDKKGKEVIAIKYDNADGFYDGLCGVKLGDKWGYIDSTGKMIIPLSFDRIQIFKNGIAVVVSGGKWGAIDKTGKPIIPFEYEYVTFTDDGKISVQKDGAKFFIDKNGNKIN
ncbi:MAG: WG repeat-containing protein [Ginsengibacter sp.]